MGWRKNEWEWREEGGGRDEMGEWSSKVVGGRELILPEAVHQTHPEKRRIKGKKGKILIFNFEIP
jgi:hypothetical protein